MCKTKRLKQRTMREKLRYPRTTQGNSTSKSQAHQKENAETEKRSNTKQKQSLMSKDASLQPNVVQLTPKKIKKGLEQVTPS